MPAGYEKMRDKFAKGKTSGPGYKADRKKLAFNEEKEPGEVIYGHISGYGKKIPESPNLGKVLRMRKELGDSPLTKMYGEEQ